MLKRLKKSGIIILFLLAGFLFLVTLRESCGQIEVLPGEPASPVEGKNTTQGQDIVDAELKRLELVLSEPLIFFVLPTFEEEGYLFDLNE
jgi:hypothetical protein